MHRIKLFCWVAALSLFMVVEKAFGQSNGLESIYLQTNKEVFETGEDLWFSATLLDAQTLQPSLASPTLYVQLLSSEGEAVLKEMYPITNGFTEGHLLIGEKVPPGDYSLLAFTPNSLQYKDQEIKSIKKIQVRAEVIPELLIETKFDKAFYTLDDTQITATVKILHKNSNPLGEHTLQLGLYQKGKRIKNQKTQLAEDGTVKALFAMPKSLDQLSLNISVTEKEGHSAELNSPVPIDRTKKLQFNLMPEGGKLIAMQSKRIAFKAVDVQGRPFEINKALVYNKEGETIATLATEHAGMGAFYLIPEAGQRYSVKILEPLVDSVFYLPAIETSGHGLSLQRQDQDELWFGLTKTNDIPDDSVYVSVKQRGLLLWEASTLLNGNGKIVKVPTANMPQGIIEVTLLNKDQLPLAGRLTYINLDKRLTITTELSESNYGVKEKGKIKVKVTDSEGRPAQTAFGLSLVDEAFTSVFPKQHILSYYMLSNDLRGTITEPAQYFDPKNIKATEHLDLLMMTQGWRDYEWSELLNRDREEISAAEMPKEVYVTMEFEGDRERRKPKPKEGLEIQMVGMGGISTFITDSLQGFEVDALSLALGQGRSIGFRSLREHLVIAGVIEKSPFSFDMHDMPWHLINANITASGVSDKNWQKLSQSIDNARKLDDFVVEASSDKIGRFKGQEFKGRMDYSSNDYVCEAGLLNCPRHSTGTPPIVGKQYFILSIKNNIPVKMERVVYQPKVALNPLSIKGYYPKVNFYEPQYDAQPEFKTIPDFRNTLIWKPNVLTDENGMAEIEFYTSDIRNIFNGSIEAYGLNGQFGVHFFDVKVLK
uniref:hypothetical protein n=1 Tax=Roseivirga sp. TaxID=1964215 RepID=UPI00404853AB